jgi:tetratricopeptide (TPR) repeat protein
MRVPAVLLAITVALSVLAIGTVHLPVLLIVAALAFASAALALRPRAEGGAGLSIPLPTLLFGILAAYTLIQAVPLPIGWLRAIAPANADVWERSLLPLGEAGPRWASISLDPGASMVEALKWATYAAVFATASRVASCYGAKWGVAMVFGAATAAALTTLGHGLAGATKVYGLYQPTFWANAWHIGPLLNPNNLAGYLNLGALAGLGLLLSHRPVAPRWLIALGVALIVAIDVSSASRGGVFALPVGLVALAAFARRKNKDEPASQSASTWLLLFAVAGGGVLAMLGGNSKAWAELYDKNLSKLEMVLWVKPMVRDHPFFGVGRGAFESVFPAYRATPGNVVYTHAENFVAQWATEWGLPVACAALGAFVWAFGPRRLGVHRSALAAGAWSGVAVLMLQNLVDLGLEIPALCIGAATLLGSLWGDSRRHGTREAARAAGGVYPGVVSVAVGGAGAALVAAALLLGRHDVASDRADLLAAYEALPARPGPRQPPLSQTAPEQVSALRADLRRAMLRHPGEPYFPLIGALVARRARDHSPIPWLQRTLERGQVNGAAHLVLAEVLAGGGARAQALLELRIALEDDGLIVAQTAAFAVAWARSFEDVLVAVPDGLSGVPMLIELGRRLSSQPERADLRGRCDREAIARDPAAIAPRVREAEARIDELGRPEPSPLCGDHAHCRDEILEHADAIARADPDSATALNLRARIFLAEGKPEEAVKLLEKECDRVGERVPCLRERAEAAARIKAGAPLASASKELLGAACVTNTDCADTATWLANLRLGRNEASAALALLTRAAREDPSDEARWIRVADAATRAGAHVQAAEALEKVAKRRGGADPDLLRRIDEERKQALGGLLAPVPAPP